MTRFIAADELIGDLPAPQVRLALRRLGSEAFDAEALARSLRPARSTAQGRALLSALAAAGLVERAVAGRAAGGGPGVRGPRGGRRPAVRVPRPAVRADGGPAPLPARSLTRSQPRDGADARRPRRRAIRAAVRAPVLHARRRGVVGA